MRTRHLPMRHRTPAGSGGTLGPRWVSFALATTAVYGDLLKRVLSPLDALISLYFISAAILMFMMMTGKRRTPKPGPAISNLVLALVGIYVLQFSTRFDIDLLPAVMMLTYMAVPLLFIAVIIRVYPEFDLRALALYVSVLMVPMHAVGLVQQFVDPTFMVSTAYSETGGVIARNFLEGTGFFSRLPSLFASADRYAGVSAMQFALSFLLGSAGPRQRSTALLLVFSVVSAFTGLLLAGARSRILIVGVSVLFAGAALLIGAARGRLSFRDRRLLSRSGLIAALILAGSLSIDQVRDRIVRLPIFSMLVQTAESGDVQGRFGQGLEVSEMPDDVKLFGEGLGQAAEGRPGEFGVRAMWIEGGVFWTSIMLIVHLLVVLSISFGFFPALRSGEAVLTLLLATAVLHWINGVLAGLSATFELSMALLYAPLVAVGSLRSNRSSNAGPGIGRKELK